MSDAPTPDSEPTSESKALDAHPARAGARGAMDERARSDRRKAERRVRQEPIETDRRSGQDRRSGTPRRKRSMNQYDMGADVLEFVNAINQFKQRAGKAFPTWSEVLGILRELGYEKRGPGA